MKLRVQIYCAFCYLWTEVNGKRESCEISSCLYQYIISLPPEIKEISLFGDTCGGQNRIVYICALLLYLVKTLNLEVIEQKFLESGHSYMEADSMHSAIEEKKKHIDVFSVHHWVNVMKQARLSNKKRKIHKSSYSVKELNFKDFFYLKMLSAKLNKIETLMLRRTRFSG